MTDTTNLNDYVRQVRALADGKGFGSGQERIWEMLALIHTEVSEATDAYKKGQPMEKVGEELIDAIIRIAKDRRAIAEAIVDVAVAVDVPGASALAVIDVDGAVVAPVAEGGRDAERQALHRALILGVRLGEIAPGLAGHDRNSDLRLHPGGFWRRGFHPDRHALGHCLIGRPVCRLCALLRLDCLP